MEKGGGYEVPFLAEKLLSILSYQERKGQFSLKVYPLVNLPYSSRRPYIQEYLSNTNRPRWRVGGDTTLSGPEREVELERTLEEG